MRQVGIHSEPSCFSQNRTNTFQSKIFSPYGAGYLILWSHVFFHFESHSQSLVPVRGEGDKCWDLNSYIRSSVIWFLQMWPYWICSFNVGTCSAFKVACFSFGDFFINLYIKVCLVCPTYCILHFQQVMQYIRLELFASNIGLGFELYPCYCAGCCLTGF